MYCTIAKLSSKKQKNSLITKKKVCLQGADNYHISLKLIDIMDQGCREGKHIDKMQIQNMIRLRNIFFLVFYNKKTFLRIRWFKMYSSICMPQLLLLTKNYCQCDVQTSIKYIRDRLARLFFLNDPEIRIHMEEKAQVTFNEFR